MIHTNLPLNRVVFLLLCELTRSAIYGSQKFDSHKWLTVLVQFWGKLLWIIVFYLLLQHLSINMHFTTNDYKRFSKTNSTDPRQRVPLNNVSLHYVIMWQMYSHNIWSTFLLYDHSISSYEVLNDKLCPVQTKTGQLTGKCYWEKRVDVTVQISALQDSICARVGVCAHVL